MTSRQDRIRAALVQAFEPARIEVEDESARHAGHAGAAPGGETHYRVMLVSSRFEGMSRVARSRAVHEALTAEFASGLHALSLDLRVPEGA
ncbi:MAG TPA: BolA family protein [Acetobacteraceae bacterium]|nr:BolA family protein [Acetobacteraceae bacterium]